MFYVWIIGSEQAPEGAFLTTGVAGVAQTYASREAAQLEADRFARRFPAVAYTVHEGDPYSHRERMVAAQAVYPINPDLPMELEDGTPVELVEVCERFHAAIRVRPLRQPTGHYPAWTMAWHHRADSGEWVGDPSFLKLRNVDPNAPQLPAWKLKARYADHTRPAEAKVPWKDAEWHKAKPEVAEVHFPHLALEDDVPMVAFYASEQHAERERLTKMRPGRYLKRYFGETLDNEEIERLTAEVTVQAGAMTVRWTQDADEIETIYRHGPSSCMSGPASKFIGHCHPARVYAGPDLGVAWLGDMDDATARCIVWPERKIYGAIYGDCSRMTLLLQQAGFTDGSFEGARFQAVRDNHGNGWIMPYIDIGSVTYDGEHMVIDGQGRYVEEGNTCGTSEDNSTICERCDDRVSDDETSFVVTQVGRYGDDCETWCEHCVSNYASLCHHTDEYVSDGCVDVVEIHGSPNYVSQVREDRMGEAGFVYIESREEWWHVDCTFTCEDCLNAFHVDDRDGRDTGADLCKGCANDRAEAGDEGNVVPALQPAAELLAAEAEGQMRLPLGGELIVTDIRSGETRPGKIVEVDKRDTVLPYRVEFNGDRYWFQADGTGSVSYAFRAEGLPAAPHLAEVSPVPSSLALAA